jgi:hypothetical protein
MLRVHKFVRRAIGELEDFNEQVNRETHQLPATAEMCLFCQAVKRKDGNAKSC